MERALVGREVPLRALGAALDAALDGRGQLAVVSGEAGLGKTAIATAIARDAEGRGATVTWGRAWEFADAPPYFPVAPCLRSLALEAGAGGHEFQFWETVLSALARASTAGPQVWIVEDLHAADLGTLDLLTFLAQPLRALRVLVVATTRANDPRLTDRMTQRLARMTRDGLDIALEPLDSHAVGQLTEDTLGRAVPASTVERLVDLTGGNPLFVVECARAFRAAGGVEKASLPPTVRQIVLDRVASLPESTRDVLARGAILGREFSAALVARMADSLPARAIDTLLPALRIGLVRETKPGTFLFSHTLVRDAIDDALGAEARAELHGRAERALERLGDTADVLVERARHALAAARANDGAHALEVADRATAMLESEGAFDRAFELHARVDEARIAGFLPSATGDRKLHVAGIAREAGRSDVCRRSCEEVIAAARVAGDAVLFARAALLHGSEVRVGVIDHAQVALYEEVLALLGDTAPELACRVLARLSTAMQPAVDPAAPMAVARRAIALARATGDDAAMLDVLEHAGWGLIFGPPVERAAITTELVERALRAGDRPRALRAYAALAFIHIELRDFDAFDRDCTSMLALADEVDHPRHRWRALLLASGRAVTLGRFAESERYVTEVVQLAPLIDDPSIALSLVVHQVNRAKIMRRSDDAHALLPQLAELARDLWNPTLFEAVGRASLAARSRDLDTTRAALAILDVQPGRPLDVMTTVLVAEACAFAGTDEQRRWIRDRIPTCGFDELSGGQLAFLYEGTIERLLGLLDASLGELESAERYLREARELAVQRRHAPWVAQLSHELGTVVARRGRADEARGLVEDSERIARELGMTDLAGVATAVDAPTTLRAQLDGEVWTIERGANRVTVKDSRGMRLLARLFERPGEEVHVLALASDDGTSAPESTSGEVLDDRARRAYRDRLAALDEQLEAAERAGDARAAARVEREQTALRAELAKAVGLGGRARHAGSATERARINVQKRLKDAVARIAEVDESLGRFLADAVRTGTYCCFRP